MPLDNWFAVSWSLSVEEWFYLLFSALLIGGVVLTGSRKTCSWGVMALFIAIPTILRWQFIGSPEWDNHVRDVVAFRLDAITYGVVIAMLYRERSRITASPLLLAAAGLAILVEQWFQPFSLDWLSPHAFQVLFFTIPALAFSLCLPAMLRIQRLPTALAWVARKLSTQAYALYLTHLTLLDAVTAGQTRFGLMGATCIVISVVAVFGLSYALHHWFEAPIMARRPKQYHALPAPRDARNSEMRPPTRPEMIAATVPDASISG
jgi:peptidoglycan/LPS O-acetylase OafA/YrhL